MKGNFSCNCDHGYSGDGTNCADINECDNKSHNCDGNATCTNNNGSFSCACNLGYSGSGVTCSGMKTYYFWVHFYQFH